MYLGDQSPLDYCANPRPVQEMMKVQKRLKKGKTTEAIVANYHPDAKYPCDQSQSYQEIQRVCQEFGFKFSQKNREKWVRRFYNETGHKKLIRFRVAQLATPPGLDRVQDSVDMWYGRAYIRSPSVMSAYLDSIWLTERDLIIAHLRAFLSTLLPKANGNVAGAPAELDPLSDLGAPFLGFTVAAIPPGVAPVLQQEQVSADAAPFFDPFDHLRFNEMDRPPTHVFRAADDPVELQQSSLESDWGSCMNFQ